MSYIAIKQIHILLVTLSLTIFFWRAIPQLQINPAPISKLMRVLPHIIDTLLLLSGVWLIVMSGQYPWLLSWLALKLLLLLVYIVCGAFAVKYGKLPSTRRIAFLLSLICISLMLILAYLKPHLY